MKNPAITILSIVTLAGLVGCDEAIRLIPCTDDIKTSVLLSLEDELGAVIEGAAVSVTDGVITEDCQELSAGQYNCGEELAGELTISMVAYGFEPEELDVSVEEDECHVIPQEIAHTMEYVSCTADVVPSVMVSVSDEDGAAIADAQVSYAPLSEDIEAESIDCWGFDDAFYCGEELPGVFNITAEAAGFQVGNAEITVEMDELGCHVITESVDFILAAE